ncbi:hypothetical protein ATE67_20440 [Sphingopyxis sp. H050]|nr:hypothetical protein ATE71_19330 [Sphingopyxis sp. H115]KTE04952.1 hypothetical protein ATE76_22560 [Sphingopyxis sp. H093]KTE17940.1 hypothetical protein ATE67_20440 [Sphingopyxis sp. H050]KTE60379.1 hypothetical protein ATE74_22375 [Sphingopyxis sp. H085]
MDGIALNLVGLFWLHQFYAISERVGYISAIIASERFVFDGFKARVAQPLNKGGQICDCKCRMGFPSGSKILFNAKMHFQRTAFEPASTPFRQMRRFIDLRNPKKFCVEAPGGSLFSGGHR